MTVAYINRPHIELPPHLVTTDEILADIERHHADHPRRAAIERVVRNLRVETRFFMRPLDAPTVSGDARITERNIAAYEDARRYAIRAARGALDHAGLAARDIGALVTSHTTSWVSPGLDVDLVNALGLRAEVHRLPMSTLGCLGGAHVLAKAARELAALPGGPVLVVVAETLSTVYNHHDVSLESMIYKALFGDSAAAAVVSATPLGPGMAVEAVWEHVVPDSTDRYRGRLDMYGLHFDSTRQGLAGIDDVLPELGAWLRGAAAGGWKPRWVLMHPGGPRILADAASGLALDSDKDLRHSWSSMRERGNLGGAAVLDVLSRFHDDPPPVGTHGLALGFGPGFTATALRGTWHA